MRRRPTILALAAATALAAGAAGAQERGEGGRPGAAGVEVCAACHEDQVAALAHDPHSLLDRRGRTAAAGAGASCAACHGDPAAHLAAGGSPETIFGFGGEEPAGARSERCLTCHGDAHPRFRASAHARAGLDCAACHRVHRAAPAGLSLLASGASEPGGLRTLGEVSASCHRCHGEVFTQFAFNERHRLEEGILDCASCHDPHEPSTRAQLAGFRQEACVRCHGDKGGPFVFEHGSSIVDGCVACHLPHGSPNRHLLTFQSTAELCYGCHAGLPGFHARFTLDTVCTNCHSSIHGSNFDPDFLK